jgi:hypothetical protein
MVGPEFGSQAEEGSTVLKSAVAAAVGVCLVGILVVYVVFPLEDGVVRSASDEQLIQAVVESSVLLRGEACTESAHGQEQYFKDQLADYWSDLAPSGELLADRMLSFETMNATPDPTAMALEIARVEQLLLDDDPTVTSGTLQALMEYVAPTPSWDPSDSPLGDRSSEIDACQSLYGGERAAVGWGLVDLTFSDVTADGDNAEATVEATMWAEYRTASGTTGVFTDTIEFEYSLAREAGDWMLLSETMLGGW